MTTNDATVTIAGLAARVDTLTDALHDAHDNAGVFAANRDVMNAALAEAIAERDALATQLAKVRTQLATASKVCALHGVALAGEVDAFHRLSTDRADAVSELDHTRRDLTACRTRIAELEADLSRSQRERDEAREAATQLTAQLATARQVIDERTAERDQARADDQQTLSTWLRLLKAIDPTAENTDDALRAVARLTARVAELEAETRVSDQRLVDQHDVWKARVAKLEARPVLDVGRLAAALNQCELGPRASDIMRHLGPVTLLPAQDRAEELIASYVDEFAARYEAEGNPPRMDRWHEVSAERRKFSIETMAATLAKLGAAATTPAPPAAPPTPWTPRRSR